MNIEKVLEEGKLIFKLSGKLDTVTAPTLEAFLAERLSEGENIFSLDFGKLTYLSSAGLRVLLSVQKKLNRSGGQMTLVNVSAAIREIFDITGFSGVLTVL